MEDGRSQQSNSWRARPFAGAACCPDRALLSKHSNQNEKPDLGQESDAHDRDCKEHVARRERIHECLASCEAPGVNHFRLENLSVPNADGARCERRRHPRRPKAKSGSKAEVAAFPEHVGRSSNNGHSPRRAARLLCADKCCKSLFASPNTNFPSFMRGDRTVM